MSNGSPDGSKTIMSSSAEAFPIARVNCEKADEGEGRVELSSPRFQIITFDLREQVMKRGKNKRRTSIVPAAGLLIIKVCIPVICPPLHLFLFMANH